MPEGRSTMLGREQVVAQLNAALASELRAAIEYMVQAQTCHNLGQARLGDYLKQSAIEELQHAEELIERIVLLNAAPAVDVVIAPNVAADVQRQLDENLERKKKAVQQYNSAMQVCLEAADNGSGYLFESMANDEAHRAEILESQLRSLRALTNHRPDNAA
jgi:bacterioferritin